MKYTSIFAAVCILAFSCKADAYEIPTHARLSGNAAVLSSLATSEKLRQLGLRSTGIDDTGEMYFNFREGAPVEKMSIRKLIEFGAMYEDDRGNLQALRHFYNPVTGLQLMSIYGATSPDWALEDRAAQSDQPFSYKKAREYFYRALTLSSADERRKEWGKTFQTLGHVIHHLQDMAQPQHVRGDAHCDAAFPCFFPLVLVGLFHPSRYEKWYLDHPPTDSLATQYGAVYTETDTQVFTTPRKFWSTSPSEGTDGAGMAQYTNRGFFSARTLQESDVNPEYPAPRVSDSDVEMVDISTLCAERDIEGQLCSPENLTGKMQFIKSTVTDSLRPDQTRVNSRALTASMFDQDLIDRYYKPVYALNRFNHAAAGEFLIPRTVGYSAGLINFFFRGKMEISLPQEGVYGIVDQVDPTANDATNGGFSKIKVKVKNVTPGAGGTEPMSTTGKLVLVAKFHRNNCYKPDLSGEYGAPAIDWNVCRSKDDEVVVSEEISAPEEINGEGAQLSFTFTKPIPMGASDLYLQVVYRGKLGEEVDGMAVATKDISEPHYLHNFSLWDQFRYDYHYPVLSISSAYTYEKTGGIGGATGGSVTSSESTGHSWEEWCTGGVPPGFPSLDACNEANGVTIEGKFSATAEAFASYDPSNPITLANGDPNSQGDWHKLDYKPAYGPLFRMVAPVGRITRIAILTDTEPQNRLLEVLELRDPTHDTGQYQWLWLTPATTINQVDETTGQMVSNTTYRSARGVFVSSAAADNLERGNATPMPQLELVRSIVNF